MDAIRVLNREEVRQCLQHLKRKRRKRLSDTAKINLIVFRLSCCCGLRVKELTGLKMKDVIVSGAKPVVHVRSEITKADRTGKRRGRFVPLFWDASTLEDLREWKNHRQMQGANPESPFLVNVNGEELSKDTARWRWRRIITKVLGAERASITGIHQGRHTFITHCLYAKRSLVAVKEAAGHRNIMTTSRYVHYIEDLEQEGLPNVFDFDGPPHGSQAS